MEVIFMFLTREFQSLYDDVMCKYDCNHFYEVAEQCKEISQKYNLSFMEDMYEKTVSGNLSEYESEQNVSCLMSNLFNGL